VKTEASDPGSGSVGPSAGWVRRPSLTHKQRGGIGLRILGVSDRPGTLFLGPTVPRHARGDVAARGRIAVLRVGLVRV
jgi:hypothetical protein